MKPMEPDDPISPAFPCNLHTNSKGMALDVYACIQLKVPETAISWLDNLIKESRRLDYAGQAMAGQCANPMAIAAASEDTDIDPLQALARLGVAAHNIADAMVKE